MRRALLDVNVLLALLDADHVDHHLAHRWIDQEISAGWASCAVTENGFVRIVSQPRYPSPVPPSRAVELLRQAQGSGHHSFWPCDVSVLDARAVDSSRLHGPRQVTGAYLLALSLAHGGRFVTFDRGLSLAAVPGATGDHLVVL